MADRTLRRMQVVNIINGMEPAMEKLSDDELTKTAEFRLEKGKTLESLILKLSPSFAKPLSAYSTPPLRRPAAGRYGALNDRCIAEMRTGEGKTPDRDPAGVPQRANRQRRSREVTVNDYLAQRDAR
ncbi:hypothetical protein MJ561_05325 [Klebsiella pneumoniae]|nr:hypothetical protein MJ561_05325 [Klebsiella pneumoniae]